MHTHMHTHTHTIHTCTHIIIYSDENWGRGVFMNPHFAHAIQGFQFLQSMHGCGSREQI